MSTRAPLPGKDIREKGMMRAEAPGTALYRRLVRFLLPVGFRERYGEELVWVFSELLMEAHAGEGYRGRATVWLREMPALLQLTWRARGWGDKPAVEEAAERNPPIRGLGSSLGCRRAPVAGSALGNIMGRGRSDRLGV